MAPLFVNLTMEAGEDWQRTVVATTDPAISIVDASMEIRNSSMMLVMALNVTNGKILIQNDGSLLLHLVPNETMLFGLGFPGVLQSVGYWGIGRAYSYDVFASFNGQWRKLTRGVITVDPSITRILT